MLASELTAGYESFSNLQLYRVNGVPILNLRHLCHLLDRFTAPHIASQEKQKGTLALTPAIDRIDSQDSVGTVGAVKATTENDSESNVYTSFDHIDRSLSVEDTAGSDTDGDVCDVGCSEDDVVQKKSIPLSEEEILFSQYTDTMENLYHRAGDDPLLLDCTNFVHFELDKDKVVVFDISSAYTKNNEILKQYSITAPRSDNLPKQSY